MILALCFAVGVVLGIAIGALILTLLDGKPESDPWAVEPDPKAWRIDQGGTVYLPPHIDPRRVTFS